MRTQNAVETVVTGPGATRVEGHDSAYDAVKQLLTVNLTDAPWITLRVESGRMSEKWPGYLRRLKRDWPGGGIAARMQCLVCTHTPRRDC